MIKSTFAEMPDDDKKMLIAELNHYIIYNQICFDELNKLIDKWKNKTYDPPIFYPQTEINQKIEIL